jgi:uncharacterized membrane protein
MKNREVGYLIAGISLVIYAVIFIFHYTIRNFIDNTCSHGPTCSMYASLSIQTWISLAVASLVLIIGLFLIFAKESEKVVIKHKVVRKTEKKKISLEGLDNSEREVVKILQEENGAIFQSSLMERLGVGKVGITRLIDKLEAKQIVERKRRGMNNIVVLK